MLILFFPFLEPLVDKLQNNDKMQMEREICFLLPFYSMAGDNLDKSIATMPSSASNSLTAVSSAYQSELVTGLHVHIYS